MNELAWFLLGFFFVLLMLASLLRLEATEEYGKPISTRNPQDLQSDE